MSVPGARERTDLMAREMTRKLESNAAKRIMRMQHRRISARSWPERGCGWVRSGVLRTSRPRRTASIYDVALLGPIRDTIEVEEVFRLGHVILRPQRVSKYCHEVDNLSRPEENRDGDINQGPEIQEAPQPWHMGALPGVDLPGTRGQMRCTILHACRDRGQTAAHAPGAST